MPAIPISLPTGSATAMPQNAGASRSTSGIATRQAAKANSGSTTPFTVGSSARRTAWPQRAGSAAPIATATSVGRRCGSAPNSSAMSRIPTRSSMIASASRMARMRCGSRPRPTIASTPSENAMSVAVGTGQPPSCPEPAVIAR